MKLSKVLSVALVVLWAFLGVLAVVFVTPSAQAQPIPSAGGSGCRTGLACRVSSLTATSTTNPIVLSTNGEVCLDGSGCARKLVYDGTNITISGDDFVTTHSIHSAVASGSRAISMVQGARFAWDGTTGAKYFESDGSNLTLTGMFLQSATGLKVTGALTLQDAGANSMRYTSHKGDAVGVVAHEFVTAASYTNASARLALWKNNTTETAELDKDGAPKWNIAGGGSKPTCNSTNRGKVWRTEGGAGVADSLEWCRKDAADAYAWEPMDTPP